MYFSALPVFECENPLLRLLKSIFLDLFPVPAYNFKKYYKL